MPGPAFLRGERVTLRAVEREDLAFVQRSRNEPAIREGLTFDTPATTEDVEEFYENVMRGDDNLNLLAWAGEERLGNVVLFRIDRHQAELAYWFVHEAQGQGYARESVRLLLAHAFDELGLHRVHAKALEFNDASQRLLTDMGFEREGVRRDHAYGRGEYQNFVLFGLLEDEWSGE
jgi:RimJ/RimL family protein N-acetyltransferase